MTSFTRRDWLQQSAAGALGLTLAGTARADDDGVSAPLKNPAPLTITGLKITPIALPDPPLLAAGGCHGPYFLRNIVQVETDAGITGIGETRGGQRRLDALNKARDLIVGQNAFSYHQFADAVQKLGNDVYAGVELGCLDACGRATGRRLCELLGGPVRDEVEFAAYLFYRFAADDPRILDDRKIVDGRGRGDKALDDWGEVRTPESMTRMALEFRKRWGFRVFKLKAGVLPPDVELATIQQMNSAFDGKHPLRIDPNGRWTLETAIRIGKKLKEYPLEYYEDPVRGQQAMADVRKATGHVMSTNSCVTRFQHIPLAVETGPIDVVLGDHHGWGGIPAFQQLGRICRTFGWGLSQHSNNHAGVTMAAMAHVGAVVPELTYAGDTHYVWLIEGADVIQGPNLRLRDGKMKVPTGAGLGVQLDPDKLARAHETYQKCGMRERNDAKTMKRVVPGWERTLF